MVMGFLNKWFGKLSGQVEKLYSKNTAQQNSHSTSAASVSCSTCGMEELQKQFSVLYRRNFPQYTILENVPARQLQADCHPACTPVQFLFCRGNQPELAVVLVRSNTYRGRNVVGTKEICERQGIGYLRFFMEMPNTPDYVIERTLRYLMQVGCGE